MLEMLECPKATKKQWIVGLCPPAIPRWVSTLSSVFWLDRLSLSQRVTHSLTRRIPLRCPHCPEDKAMEFAVLRVVMDLRLRPL